MSPIKPGYVRPLDLKHGRIDLTHGAGGRASHQLVQEVFHPAFARTWTHLQHQNGQPWQPGSGDGTVLPMPDHLPAGHRLVLSTDAHVVSPLFFPGGDIGQLAVHGTVNDLAMMGATPLHLTVSVILEEGLPLGDLVRITRSMADAACEAGVAIVTGDTKVVERGKGDGAYISTAGLGWVAPGVHLSGTNAQVGDAIVLSGPIGEHGLAVLSQREGLQFDSPIVHHTQGPGQSSGPFSCLKSPHHAGFWPPVLRVTISRNTRKRPLSRPEPSLFSVWPAGRRRWWSSKINNLRASVHRQPRPPVTTATRRRASLVLTLRQLI